MRQRALELAFDACRFTSAAPPASAPRLADWLAAGHHADMGWMARNAARRADPRLVLPGAQTIITLAVSYGAEDDSSSKAHASRREQPSAVSGSGGSPAGDPPPACPPAGRVARYARYADYHDVLGERLRLLAAFVDELGGAGTRSFWYADTGPVLERGLAERAGLGFIGKHTNLIGRQFGNWFLLAEVLTTLPLQPDPPERNRCGTCSRCLAACPTGAFVAPFTLDARRCISYLTIELKGTIPEALRPAIGDRIFGCDDCLEVCPWNRFAREGRMLRAHARPDLAAPDLPALLALDEPGFRRRFAGTPVLRAKRRGLLRNVCVALGNVGDARALPALETARRDAEPLVREHAEWAITRIRLRAEKRTVRADGVG